VDAYVHDAVLDMHMARNELLRALDDVGPDDWDRYVPYGDRTLHDLVAHLAGADTAWALAAQGLLKGESEQRPPLTPDEAKAVRERAIERGRDVPPEELVAEMERRRKLLLALFDLLEPRHLALRLPSYGGQHDAVRERIWLGYHDRLHAADVRRALRSSWHPQRLAFLPELAGAVARLAPDETLYVVYSVDPSYWEKPSPLPGWSYRNLLAHIATGDWVLQAHLRHLIKHGRPAEWPDIAAGNLERIRERWLTTWERLVDEYLSMRHETLRLLSQLKPKHLRQPITLAWEPPERREADVQRYIDGFWRHDAQHREQLRPAMRYLTARGSP
jgi:hypothetical protein